MSDTPIRYTKAIASLSLMLLTADEESGSRCYFRTAPVCCLHSAFSRKSKEGKDQDHFQMHSPVSFDLVGTGELTVCVFTAGALKTT